MGWFIPALIGYLLGKSNNSRIVVRPLEHEQLTPKQQKEIHDSDFVAGLICAIGIILFFVLLIYFGLKG